MCDAFYSNLNVSKKCKTEINILGDFNAKAGNQQFDDTVGNHRLGECQVRSGRLIGGQKEHDKIAENLLSVKFKNIMNVEESLQ